MHTKQLKTQDLIKGALMAFALALGSTHAVADGEVARTAKEAAQDTKKATKKAVRSVKDKSCELVNGKMECLGKKVKHKAQNIGDEIEDKTTTN